MRTLKERFDPKYQADPLSGCWNWTACRDGKGYGMLSRPGGGSPLRAHRVSYELHVGPIPKGLVMRGDGHRQCKTCVTARRATR